MTRTNEDTRTLSEILARTLELVRQRVVPQSNPTLEQRRADQWQRLTRAEVPLRYRREVMGPFNETEAIVAVRNFMRDDKRSILLLAGRKGTGKTFAACYPLRWRAGLYVLAAQIAGAVRELGVRARVESWVEAELLVIDELGREAIGAASTERAYLLELLERRWAACRKTILLSNVLPEEIEKRYDANVWDRIIADGGPVELLGESMRAP